MTTQITVRLPDDLVAFVDETVERGDAPSRATAVARALDRERRRQAAERDVAILIATARDHDPDDMDALAAYVARLPRPELD